MVLFGSLILAFLLLFKLSEFALLKGDLKAEIILAVVAFVFFLAGLGMRGKTMVVPPETLNTDKVQELNISSREYEVLREIANGLSNKEIGKKLHLSENTIKSHVSSLLIKLDAKRRTQAIRIARQLNII